MAIKVFPGGITKGIRLIKKPDGLSLMHAGLHSFLVVEEKGDTRTLEISRKVFEVLAAYGFSYGS